MTGESGASAPAMAKADRRLAVLLAMAMFVLVVYMLVMNVSIASVVHDLHTTAVAFSPRSRLRRWCRRRLS